MVLAAAAGAFGMQAIVDQDGSNLRQGPGTNYPVVRTAISGESFPVLATKGNWLKLRIDVDTEAWVRSDLVRVVARTDAGEHEPSYPQASYLVLAAVLALGLGLALLCYHMLVSQQKRRDYQQRLERLTGPTYIDGVAAADLDRLRRAFGISTGRAHRLYRHIYREKFAVSGLKPMSEEEKERLVKLQNVMGLSEREVGLITSQVRRTRAAR
jgi:hypothetical protein